MTPRFRLLTLSLVAWFSVAGQTPASPIDTGIRPGWKEYTRILNGMDVLRVEIKPGQPSYLSGERVCASIRVANPTAKAIEAFPPYGKSSRSNVQASGRPGSTDYLNREYPITNDDTDGDMMANQDVIWIGAGQSLDSSVCMSAEPPSEGQPLHSSFGANPAGVYSLTFEYSRPARAEFLVSKVLGSSGFAAVVLPEFQSSWNPRDGLPKNCLGAAVAALRTKETTAIVVRTLVAACRPDRYENGTSDLFAGFRRIAESASGVKNLAVSRLEEGRLRVTWTDGTNAPHQVILAVAGDSEDR